MKIDFSLTHMLFPQKIEDQNSRRKALLLSIFLGVISAGFYHLIGVTIHCIRNYKLRLQKNLSSEDQKVGQLFQMKFPKSQEEQTQRLQELLEKLKKMNLTITEETKEALSDPKILQFFYETLFIHVPSWKNFIDQELSKGSYPDLKSHTVHRKAVFRALIKDPASAETVQQPPTFDPYEENLYFLLDQIICKVLPSLTIAENFFGQGLFQKKEQDLHASQKLGLNSHATNRFGRHNHGESPFYKKFFELDNSGYEQRTGWKDTIEDSQKAFQKGTRVFGFRKGGLEKSFKITLDLSPIKGELTYNESIHVMKFVQMLEAHFRQNLEWLKGNRLNFNGLHESCSEILDKCSKIFTIKEIAKIKNIGADHVYQTQLAILKILRELDKQAD